MPTYEYTFGGPVMKDRLWFFVAGRLQKQESGRNTAITSIPYTFIQDNKRFEYKGTYSVDSNNRFVAAYTKSFRTEEGYTFNQNASMDLASLGTRELPEDLFTFNYTGVVTSKLFVEGRFSQRQLSFIGTGSRFTDIEKGTLLLDRSRGNTRYWSDTFCGVCTPYEQRDNQDVFAKGTYFLSTRGTGSHSMTFGYDNFNDVRQANNHQSGSDYRILGTSTIIQGTNVFPQFLGNGTTIIQWNPILVDSSGSNFRTHSLFYNDAWRVTGRLTANLGLRYDKNSGQDQAGATVITEDSWSPRMGFVFDPPGDGRWSVTGSVAKYVTAVANSIADASSAAGNPQTRQYIYRGPDINPPGTVNPVTSDVAIRQVFDWYNANGGPNLPLNGAPSIPGVTPIIGDLCVSRRVGVRDRRQPSVRQPGGVPRRLRVPRLRQLLRGLHHPGQRRPRQRGTDLRPRDHRQRQRAGGPALCRPVAAGHATAAAASTSAATTRFPATGGTSRARPWPTVRSASGARCFPSTSGRSGTTRSATWRPISGTGRARG